MKIMLLGGSVQSIIHFHGDLIKEMKARGHDVVACAPEKEKGSSRQVHALGAYYVSLDVEKTGINPFADLVFYRKLKHLIKREGPEIVISYNHKLVVYGSMASSACGVPLISSMVTGLGYGFIRGGGLKRFMVNRVLRYLLKKSFKKNAIVFFLNDDDLRTFRELKIIGAEPQIIRVNGSGVNLNWFKPRVSKSKGVSFILIARLLKDKGIREYVEAAKIIKKRHSGVRFKLLGPLDKNPASLKKKVIEEWDVSGAIDYLGETDDVRPFLGESSAYVLPSYREGLSQAIIEAMAMNKPIITTNVPGCRETVVEGRNGYLVPARDGKALSESMMKLIGNPELIKTMGKASREIAEERFDVRKVNKVIMEALGL